MNRRFRPTAASVLLALLALAAAGAAPRAARAQTPPSDPHAVRVAERVMEALGGRARWDALGGLRWTFGVSTHDTVRVTRRHAWDKRTGWHRVEGRDRAGVAFLFIHRLDSPEGAAWMDGRPVEGDSLQKLLRQATALWVNDTYWMLMPYKLRDPGVILRDDGGAEHDGKRYHKLALSFERVGLTPGDRYWVYVEERTGRVERWEMILQSDPPAGPPTAYTWEGWEEHGGLWFATAHRNGGRNVFIRDIETVSAFPAGTFEAP